MEEFFTDVTDESIYFPDHDVLRIVMEKNALDFHINHPVQSGRKLTCFLGF